MALRLTSQTLTRGVVARRLVSARPRPFKHQGAFIRVRPLRLRAPLHVPSTRGESVSNVEVQVAEQLGTKLSLLDETLKALQGQLEMGEVGQEEDQELLTQLVEEVRTEQEAWIEETKAMDKLVKEAADLDTSEEELAAMTKQHETLKRKVELYTGLLQERSREVSVLRSQLQDIHEMGELKQVKDAMESKQVVAAGSASVETDATPASTFTQVPGFDGFGARRSPARSGTYASPQVIANEAVDTGVEVDMGVEAGPEAKQETQKSVGKLLSEAGFKGRGMEMPGLVIVSVLMGARELFSMLWREAKQKLPRELQTGVEAA